MAIRHQDDDAAFRIQIPQPVQPGADRGANCGSILNRLAAGLQSLEICQQKIVVERERRRDVRPSGKRHQPDPVRRPVLDESLQHLLGHRRPVYPLPILVKILSQHTAGQVKRDHDIDAARLDFLRALTPLRTRHANDEKQQRSPAQQAKQQP